MNTFVMDRIHSGRYWTGGYKAEDQPRYWYWNSDDSKVSYTNWDWMNGEPNNQEGTEDRITINNRGLWNDLSGDAERRFICSRKATPGFILIILNLD